MAYIMDAFFSSILWVSVMSTVYTLWDKQAPCAPTLWGYSVYKVVIGTGLLCGHQASCACAACDGNVGCVPACEQTEWSLHWEEAWQGAVGSSSVSRTLRPLSPLTILFQVLPQVLPQMQPELPEERGESPRHAPLPGRSGERVPPVTLPFPDSGSWGGR